ncbi:FAD/NAD(P)-binding domain-containing protein [Gonapodya prolifera JEL478]|uniref:FAD/NAD(P)-binding domain-containing protein n=1 Tax=Gonapodya prolifera (strain JEL478) TaxID=1344416 RepID=A0A139ANA7_GONPJ|nr:FAD/NAD(P)-binding domain-containing protein [Gonapodya prolifera JEL478]|eukprot:KXS18231.1 FAD/NAD(P)-binding domain-containing protein [Gonapodya prolifera JEL478]
MSNTKIAIIGAGVSGLCMAIQLKRILGTDSFEIFESAEAVGGTWHHNRYPACGCDVPSHVYQFSFAMNPDWTSFFVGWDEIRAYIERVATAFDVKKHIRFNTTLLSAKWDNADKKWNVVLRDNTSGKSFERDFKILVSAIGSLHRPFTPSIVDADVFRGLSWHTARWRSDVSLAGKRVAVIGNGCSAVQAVPEISKEAKMIYNFAREPHWLVPQENVTFGPVAHWIFRNVPFVQRLLYLMLVWVMDSGFAMLKKDSKVNARWQKELNDYIIKTAPEKYHSFLIPKYEAGCKRRVFDTKYLSSLHKENVELVTSKVYKLNAHGIITEDGREFPVDVIVYATGFESQNPFGEAKLVGADGVDIHERWKLGGEALHGTVVAGMPNFFILMGPNTVTGHMSVIWTTECQVNYALQVMEPLLSGRVKSLEPRKDVQKAYNEMLQRKMQNLVWLGSCKSWYVNEAGKNTTLYPDYQHTFWWETLRVDYSEYLSEDGKPYWRPRNMKMLVTVSGLILLAGLRFWRKAN